jgi:cell division protein FtsA
MSPAGSRKQRRPGRGGIVAALDVGSTKVCCLVARVQDAGSLKVIGSGHHLSMGVRAGAIVDMDAVETSIGAAVHAAEKMAGETVRDIVVNLSAGNPVSHSFTAEVPVPSQEIGESDIRRALANARGLQLAPETTLVHSLPVGFALDGNKGIRDPRGMFGERLGVQLHVVTAATGAVRTLHACVARCHLDIESTLVSPYASALATLVPDEKELGGICVDMGGGTTSIAVFQEGRMVWMDSLPIGGAHVTNDLARGLTTSVVDAERLKTLHGSALANAADDREMIDVPQVGEDGGPPVQQPRALLGRIIQPRLEEVFEMVRSRLEQSGFARVAGRRLVLTGGASQLPGTRELAQMILDKQVRIGRPAQIPGLSDAQSGPAFATVTGLLRHAVQPPDDLTLAGYEAATTSGLWGRVGLWLRENL